MQGKGNSGKPTKLHLTIDDEAKLYEVLPKISDKLAGEAFTKGIRAVVPKIFGFQVVYGADKFKVE